jgi:hypothetical protein
MEWLNSESLNLYINTNEQHKSKRIKELIAFIELIKIRPKFR